MGRTGSILPRSLSALLFDTTKINFVITVTTVTIVTIASAVRQDTGIAILRVLGITWFSGGAERDQSSLKEYKGGGL